MSAFYMNTAPTATNDATFRQSIIDIANGFSQCGLTKETVTGEINTGTVTKPGVGSTIAGFQIWKNNDGLQGSAPFFMKVEYGTGSGATDLRLTISFGTAYDGATGALTGLLKTTQQSLGSITGGTTPQPSYFSSGSGRFACALYIGNGGGPCFFGFERVVDANGAPTSKGIQILFNVSSSTANHIILPSEQNAVPSAQGAIQGSVRQVNPGGWGGEVFFGAIFPTNGPSAYPLRNFLHTRNNDLQNIQMVVSVSFYGTTAKYVYLGTGFGQTVNGGNANMLMRWD